MDVEKEDNKYDADRVCIVCLKKTNTMCERCLCIRYCSVECQAKDKKNHDKICDKAREIMQMLFEKTEELSVSSPNGGGDSSDEEQRPKKVSKTRRMQDVHQRLIEMSPAARGQIAATIATTAMQPTAARNIISFLSGHGQRTGEGSSLQIMPPNVLVDIAKMAYNARYDGSSFYVRNRQGNRVVRMEVFTMVNREGELVFGLVKRETFHVDEDGDVRVLSRYCFHSSSNEYTQTEIEDILAFYDGGGGMDPVLTVPLQPQEFSDILVSQNRIAVPVDPWTYALYSKNSRDLNKDYQRIDLGVRVVFKAKLSTGALLAAVGDDYALFFDPSTGAVVKTNVPADVIPKVLMHIYKTSLFVVGGSVTNAIEVLTQNPELHGQFGQKLVETSVNVANWSFLNGMFFEKVPARPTSIGEMQHLSIIAPPTTAMHSISTPAAATTSSSTATTSSSTATVAIYHVTENIHAPKMEKGICGVQYQELFSDTIAVWCNCAHGTTTSIAWIQRRDDGTFHSTETRLSRSERSLRINVMPISEKNRLVMVCIDFETRDSMAYFVDVFSAQTVMGPLAFKCGRNMPIIDETI